MSLGYDPPAAWVLREQFRANGHAPDEEPELPFPTDDLPSAWGTYVAELAEALPVPAEMVALPMLVEMGSLIGNRVVLVPKSGWQEMPTLFGVVVAESGGMKTPSFKAARWPMRQLQRDARIAFEGQLQLWQEEHARWEGEKKAFRGPEPPRPVMRDYFTTDATMEAVAPLLKTTPGIVYEADEIVAWVQRMNQYRKGGDRQQYMMIHSGEPIKVNRKSQDTIFIERPVVGVCGGVQPDVLTSLKGDVAGDDGFVYRYLPVVPRVGPKKWNTNSISTDAYANVARLFRDVDRLPFVGEDGEPLALTLGEEATAVFAEWSDRNSLEAWRLGGAVRGFYVKLEAHVARFVLILHVAENPSLASTVVGAETVHRAIRIGEFFRAHIHRFIRLMGLGSGEGSTNVGVWSRVQGILQRELSICRSVDLSIPENADSECGWVPFRDIQRGFKGQRAITREYLENELDTYIDSRRIDVRTVRMHTGERKEYRLSLTQGSTDRQIDSSGVPWEVG